MRKPSWCILHQAACILPLLAMAAWGDSYSVTTIDGYSFTSVVCCSAGLSVVDWAVAPNIQSNGVYFRCNDIDFCGFSLSTGPLIAPSPNEWIFGAGGTVDVEGTYDLDGPPPPGFVCNYDPHTGAPCIAPPGTGAIGTFSGDVVMTLVGDGLYEDLIISGPVNFTIAAWLPGIATQYSGVATIEITEDITFNDYESNGGRLLEGTSVPEPSSAILIVSMLIGIAFVARRGIGRLQLEEAGHGNRNQHQVPMSTARR